MNKIKENMKRLIIAMLVYAVVLYPTMLIAQQIDSPWRYATAVVPAIPLLAALYFFIGAISAINEGSN